MIITNKLTLDLQTPGTVPTIHAVQNDSYSRNLEIALYEGRKPFVFPVHGTVVIRYKKSDGKGGEYDTLPDGKVAWWTKGNLLTISLAPQVLTTPGSVLLSVSLLDSGTQLSVFPIRLAVDPIAAAKAADSENYFYLTGLLPAPVSAEIGQCLRISAVADSGRITALEAITPNTLFGNIITQAAAGIGIAQHRILAAPDTVHGHRVAAFLKVQIAADIVHHHAASGQGGIEVRNRFM